VTNQYKPLETTILHIEILRRIPAYGRKVTARQLLEQLEAIGIERDVRTIQRQLEALSSHFKLERDERNKPYGYSWAKGEKGLAVPNLSVHESLLLYMAKQHLNEMLPESLKASMESFFVQAQRNLMDSDQKNKNAKEWTKKITVLPTSQPLLPPEILPNVYNIISSALYNNQYVRIVYKNTNDKITSKTIMPLGLAIQGPRQYLVCRFEGYEDERILALHRILSAEQTTLTFSPPSDFDLKKHKQDQAFNFGTGTKVKISFHMHPYPAKNLIETPLSKDQKAIRLRNGKFKIIATVIDSLLLTAFLNSFGNEISNIIKRKI
jgi:predicted DNA-binding transcriptional regulator YafY